MNSLFPFLTYDYICNIYLLRIHFLTYYWSLSSIIIRVRTFSVYINLIDFTIIVVKKDARGCSNGSGKMLQFDF
jgi:hypothetical protein